MHRSPWLTRAAMFLLLVPAIAAPALAQLPARAAATGNRVASESSAVVTPSDAARPVVSSSKLPGRVVDVAASEHAFRAPDTILAGLTTFRLSQEGRVRDGTHLSPAARQALGSHAGDETYGLHMLWLVRLDSGRTAAELFAAAQADSAISGTHMIGGPGFVFPPRTTNATMVLEPGNYVLVCYVGSAREDRRRYHLLKGMLRPLTVVPSPGSTSVVPEPDVVVTMDSANVTTLSGPVTKAGSWRVLFRNQSPRSVEVGIRRVHDGHTVAEAQAWRRRDGTPPVSEPWGGVVGLRSGSSMLSTVDFIPGTYIVNRVAFVVP